MSRRASVVAVVLASVLAAAAGQADVRLELAGSASAVAVELRATNAGDSAATAVTPEVTYQHQTLHGEAVPIAAGATHVWSVALPTSAGPGTFPATARVRYTDGTTTPSVPLVVLVTVPTAPEPAVRTALGTAVGPGFLTARLDIDNQGARQVAGRVVFVLPSVLNTDPESVPVQVGPRSQRAIPIGITSRGARSDATYPVYAVLEYDDDGAHHAIVARLDATDGGASMSRAVPLTVGTLALAGALLTLAVAWRAAARRRPD